MVFKCNNILNIHQHVFTRIPIHSGYASEFIKRKTVCVYPLGNLVNVVQSSALFQLQMFPRIRYDQLQHTTPNRLSYDLSVTDLCGNIQAQMKLCPLGVTYLPNFQKFTLSVLQMGTDFSFVLGMFPNFICSRYSK